ncbi:MAG: hypothetical protein NEA02_04390 [Thermoanaerobaculia bacterium]|nr:hypothetical protein [Thermoanaerobaculia bacterium]
MKRILFAPSRTAGLKLATLLIAAGCAVFSLHGEEGPTFSATVDRASVSLGDRVVVTYSARIPAGSTLTLDALVTPAPAEGARPPGGAVLEFESPAAPTLTKSKTGDSFEWSQTVALFPFSAGTVSVPGPHYTFEESSLGRKLDVRPPAVELTVASRLPPDQKPDEIAPKADKPVRIPAWPAKYWVALAAGVALAASLVAWLVSRRRGKTAAAEPAVPAIPPGEELRLALARLAAAAEGLGDDARDFYSELTHAVKRFLERATGDPVLEWTTFETVRRLRERGFEFPREAAFPDLLASADRVKFGKGAATREDARQALVRARVVLADVEARQRAEEEAEEKTQEAAGSGAAPKWRAAS